MPTIGIAHVSRRVGETTVALESGTLAHRADGAVTVTAGDTIALVTAVALPGVRAAGPAPLRVDVEERMYAVGRIPFSGNRREGPMRERATLTGRLIDRALRPALPPWYRHETQVIAMVLQVGGVHQWDTHCLTAASAALVGAGVPMDPLACVRLALIDGAWLADPTFEDLHHASLELVVAGRASGRILAVEAAAHTLDATEADVDAGLEAAMPLIADLCEAQRELGPPAEREWVREVALSDEEAEAAEQDALEREALRNPILDRAERPDGRGPLELRPLDARTGLLPLTHGSATFARGQTRALGVVTLDMPRAEQRLDTVWPERTKRFMLHYNFPPFSVGEVDGRLGPSRRDIGHGALVEKALLPVLPPEEVLPHTIRVVSDVVSSNGSTSMASVCAGSLALMDAGVPVREAVAGISIGRVSSDEDEDGDGDGDGRDVLLVDIAGIEDHHGDMDFKVAGTRDAVTAIQLDVKSDTVTKDVLARALVLARDARHAILDVMASAIAAPREHLAPTAPRILVETIPVEKIGALIGPKGKTINEIAERTGAQVEVDDDGRVFVAAPDGDSAALALELVRSVAKPRVFERGDEVEGTVVNVTRHGAFVSLAPGRDGLLPASKVRQDLKTGHRVRVRIADVRPDGKIALELRS